jgi:hypothetical protein
MLLARLCDCSQPIWDGESCVRCGRILWGAPERTVGPWTTTRTGGWTRAGVVRALKAFAFFRDRPPNVEDWEWGLGAEWPDLRTVERLFGSFPDALNAAGLA